MNACIQTDLYLLYVANNAASYFTVSGDTLPKTRQKNSLHTRWVSSFIYFTSTEPPCCMPMACEDYGHPLRPVIYIKSLIPYDFIYKFFIMTCDKKVWSGDL